MERMGRITFWISLVFLGVFLCHVQMSAACSCVQYHPQTLVCQSDFVFIGRVKEIRIGTKKVDTKYKIAVRAIVKATPQAKIALSKKSVVLRSASSQRTCGQHSLTRGRKWVLGGSFRHGKLYISLCDLAIPWSNVTTIQQSFFREHYRRSCSCKISIGYSSSRHKNVCILEDQSQKIRNCQEKYGLCDYRMGCSWHFSKKYKKCIHKSQKSSDISPTVLEKPVPQEPSVKQAKIYPTNECPELDSNQSEKEFSILSAVLKNLVRQKPTVEKTKIYPTKKCPELDGNQSERGSSIPSAVIKKLVPHKPTVKKTKIYPTKKRPELDSNQSERGSSIPSAVIKKLVPQKPTVKKTKIYPTKKRPELDSNQWERGSSIPSAVLKKLVPQKPTVEKTKIYPPKKCPELDRSTYIKPFPFNKTFDLQSALDGVKVMTLQSELTMIDLDTEELTNEHAEDPWDSNSDDEPETGDDC